MGDRRSFPFDFSNLLQVFGEEDPPGPEAGPPLPSALEVDTLLHGMATQATLLNIDKQLD